MFLRQCTVADLIDIYTHLRPEDTEERVYTKNPIMTTPLSALPPLLAIVADNGDVIGFGGAYFDGNLGFELSAKAEQHKIEFLRFALRFRDKMLEEQETITCHVYTKSIYNLKFIRWLGGKETGKNLKNFKLFVIRRGDLHK